nr:integrase, catalytic region, zinc finger, CCHC-type, peptidase aspartic, catalytic [Tanacetum cinerariifolium]
NALSNARMNASVDVNDLYVFDDIVQICLWIIDSGCSKHMMGNRALLTNFMERFLGTVRYDNNDFAVIAGYGDVIVQICLWIIDSGCSKHMTGNRALLTNFVKNFLGTVRFGNNDFAVIAGYGDVVIGSMTIKKIVQICLWIIDSGCSKHMMGNRALLTNFMERFLGTVRYDNNDFAVIAGYGDVVIGSMTIKKF